jgi:hypothetical protein
MNDQFAVVNAEYERILFAAELGQDNNFDLVKSRKLLEYLFFFINRDPNLALATFQHYSETYLHYLTSLGLIIPKLKIGDGNLNWYGQLDDLNLEKRLNSKLFSYELLHKLYPERMFAIVNSKDQVEHFIANQQVARWVLKPPFGRGGVKFVLIDKQADIPSEFKTPMILEPWYNRILDVVLHYDPRTNEDYIYLSNISKEKGQYLGGKVFSSTDMMMKYIDGLGAGTVYENLVLELQKILREIKKYKLKQPLTIDSFIYQHEKRLNFHPMTEINYRVNMGCLLKSLKKFIPDHGFGEFFTLKRNPDFDSYLFAPYRLEDHTGLINLTPNDHDSMAIFLAGKSLMHVKKMQALFFEQMKWSNEK